MMNKHTPSAVSDPRPAADAESRPAGEVHPESWVDAYGESLYRHALFKVRDAATAEDLVQETFLAGLRSRARFRGGSSEKTWLMGILKNKIRDHYRRLARETSLEDLDFLREEQSESFRATGLSRGCWIHERAPRHWKSPEASFAEREFWMILESCCHKLPRSVARAFVLREMDQVPSADICRLLNISPAHLWVMLHRARMALRRCLEKNWFGRPAASP